MPYSFFDQFSFLSPVLMMYVQALFCELSVFEKLISIYSLRLYSCLEHLSFRFKWNSEWVSFCLILKFFSISVLESWPGLSWIPRILREVLKLLRVKLYSHVSFPSLKTKPKFLKTAETYDLIIVSENGFHWFLSILFNKKRYGRSFLYVLLLLVNE